MTGGVGRFARMIPCPQLRINVDFSVAWFSGSCGGYVVERSWGRSAMVWLTLNYICSHSSLIQRNWRAVRARWLFFMPSRSAMVWLTLSFLARHGAVSAAAWSRSSR